jgi:hypothetical protein
LDSSDHHGTRFAVDTSDHNGTMLAADISDHHGTMLTMDTSNCQDSGSSAESVYVLIELHKRFLVFIFFVKTFESDVGLQ